MSTLKKCAGESAQGLTCPDKWGCQRYYATEAHGWLPDGPALSEQGCLDFLALARQEDTGHPKPRVGQGAAALFSHGGYVPPAGGGD